MAGKVSADVEVAFGASDGDCGVDVAAGGAVGLFAGCGASLLCGSVLQWS